jgi:anti-sigma factor ChrR (cupin superfamily)
VISRTHPSVDPEGDLLQAPESLKDRLARRIADEAGVASTPPPASTWQEPPWEKVAPGIFCKLLANDAARERVSMLVRLLPDATYPPHRHAGLEELHLLDGELWIDDRKLVPGDYNRAEFPSGDKRVWSETGCTCVLITSTADVLT